jgi:hypothetical protein
MEGKDFLIRADGAFNFSLFLHGLGLKFPILESSQEFEALNWKDVKLKNWTKKTTTYFGLEGEYQIERTPSNLIVWCKGRSGTDPYQLLFESFKDILSFPSVLNSKYSVRLGSPTLVGKPHFGLVDPLFTRLNKIVLAKGQEEWTDDSPFPGSVEFFDPRRIVQYLRMPERVDDIARELGQISGQMKLFGDGMKEHMKLISALQEVARVMKETLERFYSFLPKKG